MPQTVNGIGTHYYGKKNLEVETGQCEFCNNVGRLETYETGLYFVVIFIPLIPLGKKQIIDYCPSCTRHRAMPVEEWNKIKHQAIESSSTQLAMKMDDAGAAVEHLQTLTAFKQMGEAKELALAIEGTEPHNTDPDVQMFLGSWHEKYGTMVDADRCFDRAFEIDPNHKGAIRAKAVGLMEQGQLENAQTMLEDFKPPSQDFDPTLFFMLGSAFQKANRHAEAMEVFDQLAADAPSLKTTPELRKAVKISQKASGLKSRNVPQASIFSSGWLWAAVAAVVLAGGLFFLAMSFAANRVIHVVNGLGEEQLIVKIDDGPNMQISGSQFKKYNLGEGSHTVEIVEPKRFAATKEFSFKTGFWTRLFRKPVFVLDPTESAMVIWEDTVYAVRPVDEGDIKFDICKLVTQYNHVDFPFQEFPDSIELNSESSKIHKTRVYFEPYSPTLFLLVETGVPPAEQLTKTEDWLNSDLNDSDRLSLYLALGHKHGMSARCEKFLESKLDQRPLLLELHREYQSLAELHGKDIDQLVKDYDGYLAEDPKNPDLIYLRGHLESTAAEANSYYEQAIAINRRHFRSVAAIGTNHLRTGDYGEATRMLDQAHQIAPDDIDVEDYLIESLYATKNFRKLETLVNLNPQDFGEFNEAANFLFASNQKHRIQGLKNSLSAAAPGEASRVLSNLHINYLNNNIPGMQALVGQMQIPGLQSIYQFMIDIEKLDYRAAGEHLHALTAEASDTSDELIAIAALLKGDKAFANQKMDDIEKHMNGEGVVEKQMAKILQAARQGNVNVQEVKDLFAMPRQKRVFASLVKLCAGTDDPKLDDYIRSLNYDLSFPHNVIEQVLKSNVSIKPQR